MITSEVLNGSNWSLTAMCQRHYEPVPLDACQAALTCRPLIENEQRLSGCHLSSESSSGMIRVTAQASNFSLCSTWPDSNQADKKQYFAHSDQYGSLWTQMSSNSNANKCLVVLQITTEKHSGNRLRPQLLSKDDHNKSPTLYFYIYHLR